MIASQGIFTRRIIFLRQEDRRCNEAKKPGINKLKLLKYVRDTLKKYVYTPQVSSFLSFPFLTLGLAHDVLLQIAFTRRNVGLRNFECHNGTRASLSYNSIITARLCFFLHFLVSLQEWLAPLPDKSLPNLKIREYLLSQLQAVCVSFAEGCCDV